MQGEGCHHLKIYQKAHALAVAVHKMSLRLPKHEMYETGSQIRRSSKSVVCNIVEGFALRKYKAEYLHYLYRAYGSCEETGEHLILLRESGSLEDEKTLSGLRESYSELSKMLFGFIQAVEKRHDVPHYLGG